MSGASKLVHLNIKKIFFRYQRYYSKTGIQWSVYAKKEDKTYHHVPTIIRTIVENRLQDPVGMNRKVLLAVNDPRRVSAVLAPTMPPSTADLVAPKISRFNTEDPEKTLDYSWTDQWIIFRDWHCSVAVASWGQGLHKNPRGNYIFLYFYAPPRYVARTYSVTLVRPSVRHTLVKFLV